MPASGPMSALSLWLEHLPEECAIDQMAVTLGGVAGRPEHIGVPGNDGVQQVSSGNLDYRLPVKRLDEFGRLAEAFNSMTARIKEMLHARERLLLDVSRHWMPLDVVKRTLDGMEAVKLNVFHIHLSDDQGFRVESLRYPRLQRYGSDGQFYTQAQIRDIIAYAAERSTLDGSLPEKAPPPWRAQPP